MRIEYFSLLFTCRWLEYMALIANSDVLDDDVNILIADKGQTIEYL